jgi:purine nucleosidase
VQPRRKVIINEDCSGPGGSNMQTLLVMIQSPQVEVLCITVVSGNHWRDEEVAHTLRLLEIIGRTDIPVVPGAVFPLVHRREEAQLWQQRYGKVAFAGAWDDRWWHEPFVIPTLPEGAPTTKPSSEDAAHFLIRMVRKYPHEITIYEGGPMTNLALAISLDPEFPESAQELFFMGGSLSPNTDNPEFANNPRHEFNFWFDPEAAEIVLRAPWKKIVCTPTDISLKTQLTSAMVKQIEASGTPLARYIARFAMYSFGGDIMGDELAAAA